LKIGWLGRSLERTPRLLEWGGGLLLLAALLLYGYSSTSALRWCAIYAGFGLGAAVFLLNGRVALVRADLALLALFGWALLSLTWSTDPRTGAFALVNALALFGVYFLARAYPRIIPAVVMWAVVGAVILSMLEPVSTGGFGNPNFITEFFLLSAPFVLWWTCTRNSAKAVWGLAVMVIIAAGLYVNPGKGEYAVFGAAALFAVVAIACQKKYIAADYIVGGFLAVALVGGGLFAYFFTDASHSLMARVEIGMNTLVLWWESPIWGQGLGSFGREYDRVREFHLGYIDGWVVRGAANYAGAAHNEYFQLLADTGIIGLGLLGAFAYFVIKDGRDSEERLFCLAVLFVAAVLACIGFPMQNPYTAVLIAIAAGIASKSGPVLRMRSRTIGVAVFLVAIGYSFVGAKVVHAGKEMQTFKAATGRDVILAFRSNMNAFHAYPLDRFARMQLIMTLATMSERLRDQLQISRAAADRVYEISRTAAAYMPSVLVARGQYMLNSGRYNEPELERVLDYLKEYNPGQSTTWLLDAWVGVFKRDVNRILDSLDLVMELRLTTDAHMGEVERIMQFVKEG